MNDINNNKIWFDVEVVKTSGNINEFTEVLLRLKKIYPNLVLSFSPHGEYDSEIGEIRISTNIKGEYIGEITFSSMQG